MKFIDRNSVAMPAVLAEADSKSAKERAKAKEHYRDPNCVAYNFRTYKEKEVLTALNALFKNKCAYCESSYQATAPTDIEHFRPKGKVSNTPGHKGYWWLASTWNNLLPSCILCNREQHNDVLNVTNTGLYTTHIKSGKYDHFPLAGSYRAFTETDDLTKEDPLLIDPTQRDPADYLTWKKMEDLQVIVPLNEADATTPYARTSIQIYGLNRRPLVEERIRITLAIEAEAQALASNLSFASELEPANLTKFMPILESAVNEFVKKKENHPQYEGMIKYLIDREMEKILDQLQIIKERCNP